MLAASSHRRHHSRSDVHFQAISPSSSSSSLNFNSNSTVVVPQRWFLIAKSHCIHKMREAVVNYETVGGKQQRQSQPGAIIISVFVCISRTWWKCEFILLLCISTFVCSSKCQPIRKRVAECIVKFECKFCHSDNSCPCFICNGDCLIHGIVQLKECCIEWVSKLIENFSPGKIKELISESS